MTDLIDEDEINLGIRRHTDDKLTYKLIIANAINSCRQSERDYILYENNVHGLINIIYFDVRGYNLKTQIEKLLKELKAEREKRYKEEENNIPRWKFYKTSYQHKLKLRLHRWYYTTLFQRILQILASENLLLETEKLISVKAIEKIDEDETLE